MNTILINEVGNRYGRLVVINRDESAKHRIVTWLCQCDCGNTTVVRGTDLRRGKIKSCGCFRVDMARALGKRERDLLPEGESAFRQVFSTYKYWAEKRHLEFGLSEEEFRLITEEDCHYCGEKLSNSHWQQGCNGAYLYNGIDRKANDSGYTSENCVSCCEICNRAKRDMSYEEFIAYLDRVVSFRGR